MIYLHDLIATREGERERERERGRKEKRERRIPSLRHLKPKYNF
jgi:hypothetical protein